MLIYPCGFGAPRDASLVGFPWFKVMQSTSGTRTISKSDTAHRQFLLISAKGVNTTIYEGSCLLSNQQFSLNPINILNIISYNIMILEKQLLK